MKKTNKVLALLLAATMTVGMSFSAFATDNQNASFNKTYKATNADTSSPAETFTFRFEADKVEGNSALSKANMPSISDATASYTAGEVTTAGVQKTVEVALSSVTWPGVGVYYYKVTEVAGTTAGVKYDNATAYLKVTVANDTTSGTYYVAFVTLNLEDANEDGVTDSKTGGFTNEYQAVKSLDIGKTVTGNFGDKTKYFKVNVTLTGESNKTYQDSYTVTGGTKIENGTEECTSSTITIGKMASFYIKNGETIHIANVPYGVIYTVAEDDYTTSDGYDAAKYSVNGETATTTSVSGEKVDSATESVQITNNKGGTIDTGIVVDNAPYVILAAVAVLGLAMVVAKRHNIEK